MNENERLREEVKKLKARLSKLEKGEIKLKQAGKDLKLINDKLVAREHELTEINQNLRLRKQNFKSSFENINDGFFVLETKNFIISFFNRSAENILGRLAIDVVGKPLFEAFPEAKGSIFEDKYNEAFKEKKDLSFEAYFDTEPYVNWFDVKVYPSDDGLSVFFTVITERKRLETDLRNTIDFYNQTEEAGKIGGWKFDPSTLEQSWTDEIYRILEVDLSKGAPEVPEGLSFIHPDYLEMAGKAVKSSIEHGEPYDQEWIVITTKGNKKWVHAVGSPKIENGKVVSVSGSFQDITERKKAEEQLTAAIQQLAANEQQLKASNQQLAANEQQLTASEQQLRASNQQLRANERQLNITNQRLTESEKQFRKLFENMEQGFALHQMIYDKNGNPYDYKFILANRAFEKLTGTMPGEFIGKTVRELMPDLDQTWIENYGSVVRTGNPMHFEHFSKEFDRYYNVVAYSPDKDLFAVIFTDDTERILQNENLQQLNDQLSLGQSIAKLGFWTFDIKSQKSSWTDEVFKMYGVKKEEGEPEYPEYKKYIHPDDWEYFDTSVQNLINKDIPYDMQIRLLHKNNSITWVRTQGFSRKNEAVEANEYYGILQDITDYKKAEQELHDAKEKAEEADRLKSAFLANMSHEIRTPMNGILGFTSLLQDKDITDRIQQKYIEIIQLSGQRMLSTVNDLIDISKIETGQVEVVLNKINIQSNIESLGRFFNEEIRNKGIQLILTNELSEDQVYLFTDEHKVNSILTNLIKNAIKYTDTGTIEIRSKRIGDDIQISVKDSGVGIPEPRQEAIFERFVQADIGDNRAMEGSGLGLAITKAYVEMLGGNIWVESTEGSGSVFYFTLTDLVDKDEIPEELDIIQQAISSPSKKINILIAEDDEASSQHLAILLQSISNKIYFASNGTKAVEMFKDNPDIDLVLMDIKMPEMNGYEATRKIRAICMDTPIIAQTAYALEGDREKIMKEGFNDYVSKPIVGDILLRKINNIGFSTQIKSPKQ